MRISSALMVAAGVVIFVLARWLHESGKDWRPPYLGFALGTSLLGLGSFAWSGGRKYAIWFLFPCLFLATAVPWPMQFELKIAMGLSSANASIAVEVLAWFGIVARRVGNVIETANGSVGIEEACSGIRSLQTLFMLSILLGEYYRLSIRRRVIAVLASAAIAILVNIARTLVLVFISASHGPDIMEVWHDGVAQISLVIACGCVWLVVWMLGRSATQPLPRPATWHTNEHSLRFTALSAACIVAAEVAIPLWFDAGSPPTKSTTDVAQYIKAPADPRFHDVKLSKLVLTTLAADSTLARRWFDERGSFWVLYHFQWNPENLHALSARSHSPEVCLTGRSGMRLVRRLPEVQIPTPTGSLAFEFFEFERQGALWHVFFATWEKGADGHAGTARGIPSAFERIQNAINRRRILGLATLELATVGHARAADAESEFKAEVQNFLQ
jgi:exosortase